LPGRLDEDVRACGGTVIPLKLNASFPRRFIRLVRKRRYDVVHSHVLHTSGAILFLAAAAGAPVRIAHFRAMDDGRKATWRRRAQRSLMLRFIDRYATHIVACGEGAMNGIWRPGWQNDERCQIVYNSVDPTRFETPIDISRMRESLGLSRASHVFLHIGNEVAEKNHRRLLTIFAEIAKMDASARLVLVGAGTDNPQGISGRAIADLSLRDKVVTLGVRDDVPQLLRASDALLLPSRREGLPGIVLEACVVGIPVVATDLPGVREIASRLALVRCLPLSMRDCEWAATALAMPEEARRIGLRAKAADGFRASVFHIDRAVEAHRRLWSGIKGRSASLCS
jgi:glycosyltransferase involved in cell wall biosynthesis